MVTRDVLDGFYVSNIAQTIRLRVRYWQGLVCVGHPNVNGKLISAEPEPGQHENYRTQQSDNRLLNATHG